MHSRGAQTKLPQGRAPFSYIVRVGDVIGIKCVGHYSSDTAEIREVARI
jgi:hypothetical protein